MTIIYISNDIGIWLYGHLHLRIFKNVCYLMKWFPTLFKLRVCLFEVYLQCDKKSKKNQRVQWSLFSAQTSGDFAHSALVGCSPLCSRTTSHAGNQAATQAVWIGREGQIYLGVHRMTPTEDFSNSGWNFLFICDQKTYASWIRISHEAFGWASWASAHLSHKPHDISFFVRFNIPWLKLLNANDFSPSKPKPGSR